MDNAHDARIIATAATSLLDTLQLVKAGWAQHAPVAVEPTTGVVYLSVPTWWVRLVTDHAVTEEDDPGAETLIEFGFLEPEALQTLWFINDDSKDWKSLADRIEFFAYASVFRAMNAEWFGARLYPVLRDIRKHKITPLELLESEFTLDMGNDYGLHFTKYPKRLWPAKPARSAYAALRGVAA